MMCGPLGWPAGARRLGSQGDSAGRVFAMCEYWCSGRGQPAFAQLNPKREFLTEFLRVEGPLESRLKEPAVGKSETAYRRVELETSINVG